MNVFENVFNYMKANDGQWFWNGHIICRNIGNFESIAVKWDANDMVQAINAMQSKGDWSKFIAFCYKRNTLGNDFMSWLFGDPQRFFELMEEALKEGVIGR